MTDPLTPRPTDPTPPAAPTWQPPAPAPTAAPLILPTVKPKSASSRLGTYLLGLAVLVAAAGVAFAAGRVTAPAAATNGNFPRGSFGAGFGAGASFGPGGFGGGAALGANGGGVSLSGTVTAVDGSTMTLKLASGQTITIDLPGTTTYRTATTASSSAVTTGSSVVVEVTGFGGRGLGGGAIAASGAASITASAVTVETP